MKKTCLILLTSLLTACSSNDNIFSDSFRTVDSKPKKSQEITTQLRSGQFATMTLEELPFQLPSLNSLNRFDITTQSPVVKFPEGDSFVVGLQMPASMNKFTFELDSLIGRTTFVPSVIFLDENLQEVSHIDNIGYTDQKGFITKKLFDKDIYFYTDYAKKRYLNWAKDNLKLWNNVIEALEDEDIKEILKVANDLGVL